MKFLSINCMIIALTASALSITSCKHEPVAEIDLELFEMAKKTSGFTWFSDSSVLLEHSSGSGHSQRYLRTRYNSIAASILDAQGRITANAVFPDRSLVVKELYRNSNDLVRYAILYKDPSNSNADAQGWVWGYIDADGGVAVSATEKGRSCNGCHSQSENIDYMLMNKYFP
jgi:hypothetical protein